jgi:hypothetical protein
MLTSIGALEAESTFKMLISGSTVRTGAPLLDEGAGLLQLAVAATGVVCESGKVARATRATSHGEE